MSGVCPDAPASKGYQGGFKIQLMRKDFGLAAETAEGGSQVGVGGDRVEGLHGRNTS